MTDEEQMELFMKGYLKEHLHPAEQSKYQWNRLVEHIMGAFTITKRVATKAICDAGYEKKMVCIDKRRRLALIFFNGKMLADTGFNALPAAVQRGRRAGVRHVVHAPGIPTTPGRLNVSKYLAQQMKRCRSGNQINGILWSDLVDAVKGHFNVSTRRASYFIIRSGYLPRRFEFAGLQHMNGVISRGTRMFMIKK